MPFIPKIGREIERAGKRAFGVGKELFESILIDPITKTAAEIGRIPGNVQRALAPEIPKVATGVPDAQAFQAAEAAPTIAQATPVPEPAQVSVQFGTSQERARRRRSRARRQGRVFGGAGLLVPEAQIRQQTLGGF